jgi:hypothetical protein
MEMRRWERNTILLTVLGVLAACRPDAAQPPQQAHFIVADVIIAVANETSREQRIYLEFGTTQHELGTVPGHSSRSFSVPSSAGDSTNELRLQARERTGRVLSEAFLLTSGKRVVWTLDKPGHGLLVTR